jgi:two-component system, NtrC family, nitrogen regulation response regulator NtrX
VGGTASVRVDVRVLAATNKELPSEIRAGRFREDLYFRLNVIPIFVPPLHDRKEDIPLLAEHFMGGFAREYGRRVKTFDPSAMSVLQEYPWPGNVRELRNVIERLIIMAPGEIIAARDLAFLDASLVAESDALSGDAVEESLTLQAARNRFEREFILRTLAAQNNNISRTAEVLGVERSNLYRKMRALGVAGRANEKDEETI